MISDRHTPAPSMMAVIMVKIQGSQVHLAIRPMMIITTTGSRKAPASSHGRALSSLAVYL